MRDLRSSRSSPPSPGALARLCSAEISCHGERSAFRGSVWIIDTIRNSNVKRYSNIKLAFRVVRHISHNYVITFLLSPQGFHSVLE
jgi:hypothetical protein